MISVDELYNAVTSGSLAFTHLVDEVAGKRSTVVKSIEECRREDFLESYFFE